MADKQSFLTYKGKPLVRSGNKIYYGDINDNYVALLSVVDSHEVHGVQIADKVKVQLINTKEPNPLTAIEKSSDKNGMYAAIEIAAIWLERALKG